MNHRSFWRPIGLAAVSLAMSVSLCGCSFKDVYDTFESMISGSNTPSIKPTGDAGMVDSSIEVPTSYDTQVAQDYTTFAIFGVDARDNTSLYSGVNTDVIMIVSVDNSTKNVKVASVYRDTVLRMPDGSYNKVNQAQAKWNASEAVNCLNQNLDLYITDYVIVNWAATATTVNLLGGIDVDVPEEMMPYINGYLTETVNSTGIGSVQLTNSGLQMLDGPQTVAYCRIRAIDDDYHRTERQREVVKKIVEKAKYAGPVTDLEIAATVLNQSQTSFEWNEIVSMCTDVNSYSLADTAGFPFEKGSLEYCAGTPDISWPSFAYDLQANVISLHTYLYGEGVSYTPSQTVTEISTYLENARAQ